MRQGFNVSRRKVVTLVAGSLAAAAAPAASRVAEPAHAAAAETANAAALLADSRRAMLELLKAVRRAPRPARAEAFQRFATALREHGVVEVSVCARAASGSKRPGGGGLTALYRQREPKAVLANVIVRELEERPQSDSAWMTRFTDLEALIG